MIEQWVLQHKSEATDEKKIWYVAELFGFVIELDIESTVLKCLWKIPGFERPASYRGILYSNGELYVIPYYGKDLYIFNIEHKTHKVVRLKACYHLMGAIEREGSIYFYGCDSGIIKYTIADETVDYIDIDHILAGGSVKDGEYFWTESFLLDRKIFIPFQNSNIVLRIDNSDEISVIVLGRQKEKWLCRNIGKNEDKYYSIYLDKTDDCTKIVCRCFMENGELLSENVVQFDYDYINYPFVYAFLFRRDWFILPYGMHSYFKYNASTNEVAEVYKPQIDANLVSRINGDYLCSICNHNNSMVAINQVRPFLVEIDLLSGAIKERGIIIDKNEIISAIQKIFKERYIGEDEMIQLSDFVEILGVG